MSQQSDVYILASKPYGTLYVGVTSDLPGRIAQHKHGINCGFSKKYHVYKLVRFDAFSDIETAITHEKRLKRWRRDWKISLIEKLNPSWEDLKNTIWR